MTLDPVLAMDLVDRIEATGQLLAKEHAKIAAEVGGRITEVLIDEGARVEAGAEVLAIDPERRSLERDSARARVEEARESLREQEREYRRMRDLRASKVASQTQLDQAETDLKLAKSRLLAAEAQLGVVERALRDATVTAPFSGLIARRTVSRGEFVAPGQELFELVSLDPIEVEFRVTEVDSGRVALGQTVGVRVSPFPDETFGATVTFVSPTIDTRTRTLRVKAQLENPEGRLRPGLFARVDLGISAREGVPMVLEEAILQRADGAVVFRANGDEPRGARRHRDRRVPRGLRRGGEGARAGRHDRVARPGAPGRGAAGRAPQPRRDPGGPAHARRGGGAGEPAVSRFDLFIDRPVLTWMLTLSLIVFGALGYYRLGVDQFPNLEFPIVTVQAVLEGASPEVVEQDVTDVLEEYLNTIAGVRSLKSETTQGMAFDPRRVRAGRRHRHRRPGRARQGRPRPLPSPQGRRASGGASRRTSRDEPVLWLPVTSDRPVVEASEYVRHQVKPRVETVQGVASVAALRAPRPGHPDLARTARSCAPAGSRPATSSPRSGASTSRCPAAASRATASSTR